MVDVLRKRPTFEEIAALPKRTPGPLPDRSATEALNSPAVLQWLDIARGLDEHSEHVQKQAALNRVLQEISQQTGVPHAGLRHLTRSMSQAPSAEFYEIGSDFQSAGEYDGESVEDGEVERTLRESSGGPLRGGDAEIELAGHMVHVPRARSRAAQEVDEHFQSEVRHHQRVREIETEATLQDLRQQLMAERARADAAAEYMRMMQQQDFMHFPGLVPPPPPVAPYQEHTLADWVQGNVRRIASWAVGRNVPVRDAIQYFEQTGQPLALQDAPRPSPQGPTGGPGGTGARGSRDPAPAIEDLADDAGVGPGLENYRAIPDFGKYTTHSQTWLQNQPKRYLLAFAEQKYGKTFPEGATRERIAAYIIAQRR